MPKASEATKKDEGEARIEISEQFRKAAESLAQAMSLVLTKMDERDVAAISVATLKGALTGAELELKVREEALNRVREITGPQTTFYIGLMETEATDNLAHLRSVREEKAS